MHNIPQIHKFSRASQLSLLAVVILMGAVFFTVNSAMQQEKSASHASSATNILLNPSFESGTANWHLAVTSPAAGNFTTTTSNPEDGASAAQVNITSANSNNWYVQLQELYLPMTAGQTYTVTFWAKASSNRQIGSVVQSNTSPYPVYSENSSNITTSWQQYSYTFTAPVSNSDVFVGFNLASATGTVWIDNVSYSTGTASTPITQVSGNLTPAIDSSAVNDAGNNAATSGTVTNLTVSNSDTNEVIILGVGLYDALGGVTVNTSSPPTWGSQTFTKLKSSTFDSGKEDDELWYLVAPATGNHTVTVHFTGTTTYVIGAADYYNVNQTTPFGTVNTTSGNSNSFTNNVPSGPNQLPIDMVAWTAATGIRPSGTGQSAVWNKDMASPASASSYAPSAGSTTTLSWSDSSTDNWYDIGVSLLPAVAPTQPTLLPPTSMPTPQPTSVPAPTTAPTAFVAPTTMPTPMLSPIATPVPGDTIVNLNVGLHGIGSAGDNRTNTLSDCTVVNPPSACDGTMNPLHPQRTITVTVLNSQNQPVANPQGVITYDANSGKFTGTVDLGQNFVTGLYTVKVTTNQFLTAIVPGIQTITSGQPANLPYVGLIAGDVDNNNNLNILDYNVLMGCYSDLFPATNCNPTNNALSDLNDDGAVNQDDLNLFLRELSNVSGQ